MPSPIDSPDGIWWNHPIGGTEKAWLGATVVTAVILFGWMVGWSHLGEQNPTGHTYRLSPDQYRAEVTAYKEAATKTDEGLRPAGHDVYLGALQWGWDGLPVVLEAGTTYQVHLGSYDVQHGFSVRDQDHLIRQFNLQVLPGYEWVVPMTFEKPGTYRVVCNEFCGMGHRVMQNKFVVVEEDANESNPRASR